MIKPTLLLVIGAVCATSALAQRYQCMNAGQGIRNVAIMGKTMSVVNPKTPNIVFTKAAASETRGSITKVTTDAWELYIKDGYGQLTNITFGDKYTCLQTGS